MQQPTDHDSPAAEPAMRWCNWHRGPSDTAVLVRIIEQASGPGGGLYACAPCRQQHRLTPEAS